MRGRRPEKENPHRTNNEIPAPSVRLVGDNVEPNLVVPIRQALAMAEEMEMDLIEISPKAEPPVCRIADYQKFLYQQKRKAKEKERAEEKAAESRQRGTRKKQASKSTGAKKGGSSPQRASRSAASAGGRVAKGGTSSGGRGAKPSSPRKGGTDLRPGRAHRAAVAAKRSGGKRRG